MTDALRKAKAAEGGWWRVWRNGPGVSWKPADAPRLFSERYGYVATFTVCGWRFRYLPASRLTERAKEGRSGRRCASSGGRR